jgi:hypothetical protein
MTVQAWFTQTGIHRLSLTWWVFLLFGFMLLLGINTILCAQARMLELWQKRSGLSKGKLFVLYLPSLMHLVFVLMLSGHLLTFTLCQHARIPIQEGASFTLPSGEAFMVESLRPDIYSSGSKLSGRLRNMTATLRPAAPASGTPLELKILDPIRHGSLHLHLDLAPSSKQDNRPHLFLIVTKDPGLPIIVSGLTVLIALMLIYYAAKLRNGRFQNGSGVPS